MRLKYCALILTLMLQPLSGAAEREAHPVAYEWAVVPQYSSVITHEKWAPFIAQLSSATGSKFTLHTYADFKSFEDDIRAGTPDFIYLNPYNALVARKLHHYNPIIRDDEKKLTGILVSRNDSAYHTIQDLQGQDIAFPAPAAFGSSLYLRALLAKEYGITFNPIYVGSHSNAYRATLMRRTVAGGGVERTLDAENPQVRKNLRVIFRTPATMPHPVMAHPRLPKALTDAVIAFFLDSAQSTGGRELLDSIQISRPVAADYARDYAALEKLELNKFITQ